MSTLLHKIYGRHLGTDKDRYISGNNGIKVPQIYCGPSDSELAIYGSTSIQALTSDSTGTAITAGGMTSIATSTDDTFILNPPVAGVYKRIFKITTSTGEVTVRMSTVDGAFASTAGSSFEAVLLHNQGDFLDLHGLTTSLYAVLGSNSTDAFTT